MVWSACLAVGIPIIDEQHRSLFEQVARLRGDLTAGCELRRFRQHLDYFVSYVLHHFQAEERIARERRHPIDAEHAREHAAMRTTVRTHLAVLNERGIAAAPELLCSLESWLLDHVGGRDLAHFDRR